MRVDYPKFRSMAVLLALAFSMHAAELLDDFSEGVWRHSNPKAPGTVTAAPGKLLLKDHPGGEVTWGTSMSKMFPDVDIAAMPYLVIKVNRLTGGYQAKLSGRGEWQKKTVCSGREPGLVVVDIARATGWKPGTGNISVMLYTIGDGTEIEYGFVKFTDTLTAEQKQAMDKQASGGKYVGVPQDYTEEPYVTTGHVRFRFTVPRNAMYIFWARTMGPDGGSNSFFISLDGAPDAEWSVPAPRRGQSAAYVWQPIPGFEGVALQKGEHELLVKAREDGTRLDKIVITTDFTLKPTD